MGLFTVGKSCVPSRPLDPSETMLGGSNVYGSSFTYSITKDLSKPDFQHCEQKNTGKTG